MRNSIISTILLSLGMAGCAHHPPAARPIPPPPDFEATAQVPERTETPASTGRDEQIAPEDQVLFSFDSAVLDPTATKVLDDVATWVKSDPSRAILVKGHADPAGTEQYNQDLSSRRAETVASYLYGKGVAHEQVAIVAVGEDKAVLEPVDSNRRVVISAISVGPPTATR